MSEISATQVKELRERSGVGLMEAKSALVESNGNVDEALVILQKRGTAKAAKKATRTTEEGVIMTYVHGNNKLGVMLDLGCETDFVARNDDFKGVARDIAMHIAAMDPSVVSADQIPQQEIDAQMEIVMAQLANEQKPEDIKAKIADGKMTKWKEERSLLTQAFVKDPSMTIADVVNGAILKLGENIVVRRFVRMQIGQ